jgi:hypothetical protein
VIDTFESLFKLEPCDNFKSNLRPIFSELPHIHHAGSIVSKTEEQYRQMPFLDWKEKTPF